MLINTNKCNGCSGYGAIGDIFHSEMCKDCNGYGFGNQFLDHIKERNFDIGLYKNITVDLELNLLTVHLYNLDGKMVGYQSYNSLGNKDKKPNIDSKYLTYCMKGELSYWGLETLDLTQDYLFVVEGLFKASALHKIGLNAICIFGSNPSHLKDVLLLFGMELIAIGDNDEAGEYFANKIISFGGKSLPLEKDVDEYTTDELSSLMRSYSLLN